MSDDKNEQLSALVDDELDHQTKSTIDKLIGNQELQDKWSRYNLIGDCLRGNLPEQISNNVASNVMQSLKDGPTILAPQKSSRSYIKPVAGFAIAATVAMVAYKPCFPVCKQPK